MTEAYRIRRYHHVTDAKHARLREEHLLPLLERLSDHDIVTEDIDDLMLTDEAMGLHMDDIDTLEEQLNIIQNILPGDWLIDISEDGDTVYLGKYNGYVHHPHRHLFIKHFAEASHIYKVALSELPEEVTAHITNAEHLETLPLSVSSALDALEQTLQQKEVPEEPVAKKQKGSGSSGKEVKTYRKVTPQLLVMVRNKIFKEQGYPSSKSVPKDKKRWLHDQIKAAFTPGMTYAELVVAVKSYEATHGVANTPNPNKLIDKQAWAIFQQLYPGQQPIKGQIAEIREEIIRNQTYLT